MNKTLVIIKWVVSTILLGGFGLLSSPIFYPLWELTHWKMFWIWNDDGRLDENGNPVGDYQVYIDKYGNGVETFYVRYRWHAFRNTIWNLRTFILFKTGDGTGQTDLEFITDDITLGGKKVQDGGKYPMSCGLKYEVEEGRDPWQGWVGDKIDLKYSIIGESYMWFKQDGILSFRYSECKIKPYFIFWKRWRTIKLSRVKNKTSFTYKNQKLTD